MAETISVKGLAELTRDLKKLDKELPKELKKIGKDAAEIVATAARPIAPVLTGKLRDSIKPGATNKGAKVSAGSGKLVYAGPIHFGWAKHNISPNPFLYHALDAKREQVIDEYGRQIDALIDRTIEGM